MNFKDLKDVCGIAYELIRSIHVCAGPTKTNEPTVHKVPVLRSPEIYDVRTYIKDPEYALVFIKKAHRELFYALKDANLAFSAECTQDEILMNSCVIPCDPANEKLGALERVSESISTACGDPAFYRLVFWLATGEKSIVLLYSIVA